MGTVPAPAPDDFLPASELLFLEATEDTVTDGSQADEFLRIGRAKAFSRFFERLQNVPESEDVVKHLDVRDWPRAPMPEQIVTASPDDVPPTRLRRVRYSDGRVVYECWTPIQAHIESDDPVEIYRIAAHGIPVHVWRLTYHVWDGYCRCPKAKLHMVDGVGLTHEACGRPRESRVEGDLSDHILSQHRAPDDDYLNGYYATIHGRDVAHVNGHILRARDGRPITGGTEIRGGRAEYREKTKRYVSFDNGFFDHTDRIRGEQQAKRDKQFELNQEKADKALPRKIGEL